MIGYKITRSEHPGWCFVDTTPEQVSQAIKCEIEACEGLSADEIDDMTIVAYEITQEEIDNMPEFPGW